MKQRFVVLDLWRSLAVLVMLVFHALWDLELFGVLPAGTMETLFADVIRYVFGGSFILISGLLVLRGRAPLRRGFILLCLGLAVAVVTTLIALPVQFGILTLLGLCMLVCGALRGTLEKLRGPWMAAVCALLFVGTWVLTARFRVEAGWLFPLGLRRADFFSADYWPVLPWAFLYLLGAALSGYLPETAKMRDKLPALTFLGRHSLIIYLLHQPVLYGICRIFLEKAA